MIETLTGCIMLTFYQNYEGGQNYFSSPHNRVKASKNCYS